MYMRELTENEVRTFIKKYNIKSPYQTIEYGNVMAKQGYDPIYVGLVDNNNYIYAMSLILIKKEYGFKYGYAPRGFLIDYTNKTLVQNFTTELKKYLGKKDVIAVKLNPAIIRYTYDYNHLVKVKNNYYDEIFEDLQKLGYYHLGYNNFFEAIKPRYEAVLNIDLPFYMIFNNLKKSLRTKIRSAESNGVRVYKGDFDSLKYLYFQTKRKYPRDLKFFEEMYKEYSKNKAIEFYYTKLDTKIYLERTKQLYEEYEIKSQKISNEIIRLAAQGKDTLHHINKKIQYDAMFEKYNSQLVYATKLLSENPEGIITSSVLVIKNYDTVYLVMDGYDTRYKSLNSKHLLLWKIIEKYSKLGYKKFNFGGVTNIDIENNKYAGLNEFKLSFNPIINEYIGDLEIITNNTLYFMYRNSRPFIKAIMSKESK